jgi:cephalosporin hydroxylase
MFGIEVDEEITDRDLKKLSDILMSIPNRELIVEIGVDRDPNRSFSRLLIDNKPDDCAYVGIDTLDRTRLENHNKCVYTIQGDSGDMSMLKSVMSQLGLKYIDLLFVDGCHSVNQVIKDWRYAKWVRTGGAVVFHDTNAHPGPLLVFDAIDELYWRKAKFFEKEPDYGMSVAWRL